MTFLYRDILLHHPRVNGHTLHIYSWIAVHIDQFAGGIMVFAGGFVALFRLLMQSESNMASIFAWIGLALAIMTTTVIAVLQSVDGIALKLAVDSWPNLLPNFLSTLSVVLAFALGTGAVMGILGAWISLALKKRISINFKSSVRQPLNR
jgi:hypothetical protein